jgi:hypothetical protein
MEKAKLTLKLYIDCPHCGKKDGCIDHLLKNKKQSFGPWYCDSCGCAYKGEVTSENEVFVKKTNESTSNCLVFLKKDNIILLVKGICFNSDLNLENKEYFYNEYTCPTNYLKDVEKIIDIENKDDDPHGIFEFVHAIPYVDTEDMDYDELRQLVFDNTKIEI